MILEPGGFYSLHSRQYTPTGIGIISVPLGTTLSIAPDEGPGGLPLRVVGFTQVGSYVFWIRGGTQPEQVSIQVEQWSQVGTSTTPAITPAEYGPDLVHALTDGAKVGIWMTSGVVSALSQPVVLPPPDGSAQVQGACNDASFKAFVIAALIGKDADEVVAAMDPKTGSILPAWAACMVNHRADSPAEELTKNGWSHP